MSYVRKIKKHWFVVGNNWHLLVEIDNKVFHKTVIMYDTTPGFEPALETNKRLKEHDLVEEIIRETGKRVELTNE